MDQLYKLLPTNFRELFSFLSFFFSIIFSFISLSSKRLEHGLRMAAILFIVSLALFANNWYCYFGGIFIIATAVTQLDFLQNLAAIIRGSKEYFDYKKEAKPQKEVERDLEKESKVIEKAKIETEPFEVQKTKNIINLTIDKQNLSGGQFAYVVEEYAFKYLEKKFRRPIERYVRFLSKRHRAEFDGILSINDTDIILEIKTTRMGALPLVIIEQSIDRSLKRILEYKEVTKRNASLRLVLIGNFQETYKTRVISELPNMIENNLGIEVTVDFYSFEEIGLDIDVSAN